MSRITLFPPVQRHRDPHAGVTTITSTTNTAEVQFGGPMVKRSAFNTNRSLRTDGRPDHEVQRPARGTHAQFQAQLVCRAVSFRGLARPDPDIELIHRLPG